MARINIDFCFFFDERIGRLAQLTKEHRFMTEARLLRVWASCYRAISEHRSEYEIDLAADWISEEPFVQFMVRAKLADKAGSSFRIAGVSDRIEYLRQARLSGQKSARARHEKYGTAQPLKDIEGTFEKPSNGVEAGGGLPSERLEPLPPPLAHAPSQKNAQPSGRVGFDFESLYQLYPRRVGKKRGLEGLRRTVKTLEQYEEVKRGIEAYARKCARDRTEQKHIAHFSTWVNAARWQDELDATGPNRQYVGLEDLR